MEEIKAITKPVPYIVSDNGKHVVVFIEIGTTLSTYEFDDFRKAKICATEVKPLVVAAANAGLIDPNMISDEEWEIEPIVTETTDEYGFKTVTTEYYPIGLVVKIYDKDGNEVTAEERQAIIDEIEAEKRRREEEERRRAEEEAAEAAKEAARIPAQLDYTAAITSTLLPEDEGE